MEITWMGHSCFRLRSGDLAIVTDPFPNSIGLRMRETRATLATISHRHDNHSHWQGVGGNPKVLEGPGEYELSGIYVTGIMTPRGEGDPPDKRNTAYTIEMEGLKLCHLGDVSRPLTAGQVEDLAPLDILFLPVGGVCTVEIPQAIEMARLLAPRVVIPMHYGLPGLQVELGELGVFLTEMGLRDVQSQPRLNISASSLPPEMRVVVLDSYGNAARA